MTANYHTHTPRCGHASGEEREYIEQAITAGIKLLGFSDHAPMPFEGGYTSPIRMMPEQAPEYVSRVRALAEEYKDDITIYVGFEAEYYPSLFDGMRRMYRELGIDYIILGQHFMPEENKSGCTPASPDPSDTRVTQYVDHVLKGLSTGVYSYLAHPDTLYYTGDNIEFYESEMRRLCEGAKALGIPLEINLLGMRDNRHYPSDRFFRIAAQVGCDTVIGIDAHSPQAITKPGMLDAAYAFADKHGLKPLDTVEFRKI